MFGTLTIFVNCCVIIRRRNERVSSSPENVASTYTSGSKPSQVLPDSTRAPAGPPCRTRVAGAARLNGRHHDVRRLHADGDELRGNLPDDFWRRDDGRCADAVDLDADEVLGIEQARPAIADVLVTCERRHATGHHGFDRRRIHLLARCVDAIRRMNGDHPAWIGPGHAGQRGGLVAGHNVVLRNRPRLLQVEGRHGRHGSEEFATIHTHTSTETPMLRTMIFLLTVSTPLAAQDFSQVKSRGVGHRVSRRRGPRLVSRRVSHLQRLQPGSADQVRARKTARSVSRGFPRRERKHDGPARASVLVRSKARQVTRTDRKGRIGILVDRFEGKRFNAPTTSWSVATGTCTSPTPSIRPWTSAISISMGFTT